MAITEAVKETIWLQGFLDDLGVGHKRVTVFCDSQSAIHLAKNQVYHAWTKHIDVRYPFVREIIEEGGVFVTPQSRGSVDYPSTLGIPVNVGRPDIFH